MEISTLPIGNLAHEPPRTRSDGGNELVRKVDALREKVNDSLEPARRVELGQFMTSAAVSRLMSSMIGFVPNSLRILDAGAGIGSLTAAAIQEILSRCNQPKAIHVVAFEIDPVMVNGLKQTLENCQSACDQAGVDFSADIFEEDFMLKAAEWISQPTLQSAESPKFDLAIQNPPFKKINNSSSARVLCKALGIDSSNLYTAFLAATTQLLSTDGQIVAICPRSFCNGPYFYSFRKLFLREMSLDRIHLFGSRQEAFKADAVLQETIIVSAYRSALKRDVQLSMSHGTESQNSSRIVPHTSVVAQDDPQMFIHIRVEEGAELIANQMNSLPCTLVDLGLTVSTGRVVDFRTRSNLLQNPQPDSVPLLYPIHFEAGGIVWPRVTKKSNALKLNESTSRLVVPAGCYVLVKRFSSKEEPRRVVAALFDPKKTPCNEVAFENHLNYFHCKGQSLDEALARGLTAFLNTALVDEYFRQFNGHTQVNATDLRALRYPSLSDLRRMGADTSPRQESESRV